MSNLVGELLLRLVKPAVAAVLGAVIFAVVVALGADASAPLALLCWIAAAAFILLVQEGPI
jgi:ABC-type transport system involved in cytochrome bd biosynthesis fused ATPase/permease subunit